MIDPYDFSPWWQGTHGPQNVETYRWPTLPSTHALAQSWVEGTAGFADKNPWLMGSLSRPIDQMSPHTWVWLQAHRQNAGRGQLERQFFSPSGGLYLTLICPWPNPPITPSLPLVTGWVVAQVLGSGCTLKWVNDIYLGPDKLGGILIHRYWNTGISPCVISIGLNINTRHTHTPEQRPIASLAGHIGHTSDLYTLWQRIHHALWAHFSEMIALGGILSDSVCQSINGCLREYGQKVRCTTPLGPVVGICQGITASGQMMLDSGKSYDVLSLCILDENDLE